MSKHIYRRGDPDHHPRQKKLPFICWILMAVGFLTVLYLMITYVLMPVLAMLTVS